MTTELPERVAGFVRAVNDRDPVGLNALFAENAVVDDAGREIRGCQAIREWAAHDIFAANVTAYFRPKHVRRTEVRNKSGHFGHAMLEPMVLLSLKSIMGRG